MGTPLEIVELSNFMRQNKLTMPMIFKTTQRGDIKVDEFLSSLTHVGFRPRDAPKLVEALDMKGTRTMVSLDRLSELMKNAPSAQERNITPQIARDRFNSFDPMVK